MSTKGAHEFTTSLRNEWNRYGSRAWNAIAPISVASSGRHLYAATTLICIHSRGPRTSRLFVVLAWSVHKYRVLQRTLTQPTYEQSRALNQTGNLQLAYLLCGTRSLVRSEDRAFRLIAIRRHEKINDADLLREFRFRLDVTRRYKRAVATPRSGGTRRKTTVRGNAQKKSANVYVNVSVALAQGRRLDHR